MPSQLQVNKQYVTDHWEVNVSVVPGGILPATIFVHENTGTGTLGGFYGTANVNDLTRMQIWLGAPIPTFGNKFVLHDQAKIIVSQDTTPDAVIAALVINVTKLSTELQAVNTSTQIINIP